jgi:hypothetical protein
VSPEIATLLVAVVSLVVAVMATWAAIVAIRRDRADLRITAEIGAAGHRHLTVVNVGLRPVRVEPSGSERTAVSLARPLGAARLSVGVGGYA